MALVTKQSFLYDFPQIPSEEACLFDDAMLAIFEHCNKQSLDIIKFLKDTVPVEKASTPTEDVEKIKKAVDRLQVLAGIKKSEDEVLDGIKFDHDTIKNVQRDNKHLMLEAVQNTEVSAYDRIGQFTAEIEEYNHKNVDKTIPDFIKSPELSIKVK